MRMTVKNLQQINHVPPENAKDCMEAFKLSTDELVEKYPEVFKRFYNQPCRSETLLLVFNHILGMYGIESFDHKGISYSYLNSGDSYSLTVIYNYRKGNFTLNCWGDIVER